MAGKNVKKLRKEANIFLKYLSLFTALYILNISINITDSTLYGNINPAALSREHNEIESIVELLLEGSALEDDDIAEQKEQEQQGKNNFKKIDFFPLSGLVSTQYISISSRENITDNYCAGVTNYISALSPPPPEI